MLLYKSEQKTLYIFIDESGNFDFSPTGTKYFVLTAVSSLSPLRSRDDLVRKGYELKYKGWQEGEKEYFFHATEDKQEIRDWVFSLIKQLDDIEIDAVLAQKNKTNPSLYVQLDPKPKLTGGLILKTTRSEERFYDKISQILLQYIFNRYQRQQNVEKIVVVLDSIFTDKKREYVLKSLKQYLKNKFQKPFYIYFHKTATDINCQIADYCGWAVYVNVERGETRPLKEIQDRVKSSFDVFQGGAEEYYQYKKNDHPTYPLREEPEGSYQ